MPVTILIPTALRAFTDGRSEVQARGATAGEAIAAFADDYPDIRRHLYDDSGVLRSFINVYLGETNIKNLEGAGTPVKDGDILMLVPAIAGGTSEAE
ncbi:MAG: MoaD/ThiS family protein [Synergistaceae bacterium]|jgi:molybdopterin converting factor small subunit|nr:MoaD/ThiS family protein [Synergistaceae bacterium]